MSEELYNSNDYCSLAEENEELKKENAELLADKLYLIGAAMDGGDKYHYAAHDIGYRDMERKVKALEADYVISNRELLILQQRIAELEAAQKEALSLLPELEQGHYYCDDCWYSCPKAVDGCCDERQGDECNCGADNYNALLAKIIGLLTAVSAGKVSVDVKTSTDNNKRSKWKAYVPGWGAPAVNKRYLVKLINDWITIATYYPRVGGGYWKDDRGQELVAGVVSLWKGLEE